MLLSVHILALGCQVFGVQICLSATVTKIRFVSKSSFVDLQQWAAKGFWLYLFWLRPYNCGIHLDFIIGVNGIGHHWGHFSQSCVFNVPRDCIHIGAVGWKEMVEFLEFLAYWLHCGSICSIKLKEYIYNSYSCVNQYFSTPLNIPEWRDFKLLLAWWEVEFKFLFSDIDLGGKLPWDSNWHFALKLRTTLEQLSVYPIENPKILCETKERIV